MGSYTSFERWAIGKKVGLGKRSTRLAFILGRCDGVLFVLSSFLFLTIRYVRYLMAFWCMKAKDEWLIK